LKISFINHNVIGSGTYLRAYALARHLAYLGHDITLLTTSKKKRVNASFSEESGVKIVQFPDLFAKKLRNGICPWNILHRILYLKNNKFDLIHAFDTRPVVILPALYSKSRHQIPLVIDWADWWGRGGTIQQRSGRLYAASLGWIENFFEEYFRRFADASTTISTALFARLTRLGYPASRIMLLRQGTDFSPSIPFDVERCRKELRLDLQRVYIGHLGTLFYKDADLLFEAMKIVAVRAKDAKLLLIGRHKLPPNILRRAGQCLMETGEISRDRMLIYLGACNILVLPLQINVANNGRWPSKVNDYFASGRPVVSTPIGDIRVIFEKERIGLLANDQPEDFADVLSRLIEDRPLQSRLAKRAWDYAQLNLNWERIAREMGLFYGRVIADSQRAPLKWRSAGKTNA
jgi:glycosyltransferase involved in cell wall biosynthesis